MTTNSSIKSKKDKHNINTITYDEFRALNISGFTDSRIRTVLDWRDSHGKFKIMEDVMKVPMIGETMSEQLNSHFYCE